MDYTDAPLEEICRRLMNAFEIKGGIDSTIPDDVPPILIPQ
jgi:hypothetical protein